MIFLGIGSNLESKFYLRIRVKDQSGVLSKITTYLNDSNISVEKILQTPDKKENNIPILIITHEIKTSELDQDWKPARHSGFKGRSSGRKTSSGRSFRRKTFEFTFWTT